MPDNEDYRNLSEILARAGKWSDQDARSVARLRDAQAATLAGWDQRDLRGLGRLRRLVAEIDLALATDDRRKNSYG